LEKSASTWADDVSNMDGRAIFDFGTGPYGPVLWWPRMVPKVHLTGYLHKVCNEQETSVRGIRLVILGDSKL
jgi:hypothetical protein